MSKPTQAYLHLNDQISNLGHQFLPQWSVITLYDPRKSNPKIFEGNLKIKLTSQTLQTLNLKVKANFETLQKSHRHLRSPLEIVSL